MEHAILKAAIVGHVDHGKSTLVGHLLHATDSLPDGREESVREMCKKRGMPFEWAFVTDALQAERDQGITIDVSHIRFASEQRPYVLIDAPGHREFIKNMISGASGCDAALVVIDAQEGVKEQSRRHGYLLSLLGVKQIAVAVTKMDLVDYDLGTYSDIDVEYRSVLHEMGVTPAAIIPVSGRDGDNLVERGTNMPWYSGPTVLETLDSFKPALPPVELPLRVPVQDVYRFDSRRIIAGRVESGRLNVGDEVVFSPSNHVVKVKSMEGWAVDNPILGAQAGDSIGVTLEEQVFVERGEVMSLASDPPMETNVFRARLFWLGAEPMEVGKRYTLKLGTSDATVEVEQIERVVDAADMKATQATQVPRDSCADVILRSRSMLAVDPADDNPKTGRFVLQEGYDVVGGGLINMDGYPDQRDLITNKSTNVVRVEHRVTEDMRLTRVGHSGGVMWFTGLSGAGKSTLAIELEYRLFQKGYNTYVLDGDNVRHGLNANLGFSPEDRAENIRRVGEVAALFARAGMLVITAFISPYRSDRDRAREAADDGMFHEIYVEADLETCEARDPKGLYRRARAGEIADFTGISAPYEAPEKFEMAVNTSELDVEASIEKLVDYVEKNFPRN